MDCPDRMDNFSAILPVSWSIAVDICKQGFGFESQYDRI